MPPGESHVSRISKEYYVNYFNSSHRELGPPVIQHDIDIHKDNIDVFTFDILSLKKRHTS